MASVAIAQSNSAIWIREILFWLHVAIILAGLFMGLVLPLPIVIILVVLHRLHLLMFDGCILSKYQKSKNGLLESENFLQHMIFRLTGISIANRTAKYIDYIIAASSIIVAFLAQNISLLQNIEYVIACLFMFWGMQACYRLYTSKNKSTVNTCSILESCEQVGTSQYSQVLGIPVVYIGLGYFGVLITLEILMKILGLRHVLLLPQASLILSASAVSLVFIYLQGAVLKSICQSCMNVHGASISLGVFMVYRVFG